MFRLYGMRHVLSALALSERQPITAWLSSSMGSLIGKRQRRARIACALVRLHSALPVQRSAASRAFYGG